MAVQARDHIDKLLVQKYQTLQVDNHNDINHVDEQVMLDNMQKFAQEKVSMLKLQANLKHLGNKLLAKSAYKNYRYMPM